jgi:hypothetical protein
MQTKFIYLAGKYTEKAPYLTQRNIDLARRYAQEIALLGALPITPHLLLAHFEGIQDYSWSSDVTMQLMRRCDAVYMLPKYEQSNGAMAELTEAIRLEMPVFYHLSELKIWLYGKA